MNKRMLVRAVTLVLSVAISACTREGGENDPVTQPARSISSRPIVRRDSLVRAFEIGDTHIQLGYAFNFADAIQRFGQSRLIPPHSHHADTWKLCYKLQGGPEPTYVVFESDPDMGGGDHTVIGMTVSLGIPFDSASSLCAQLNRHPNVRTDNGLFLGMSTANMLRIAGTPKSIKEGRYEFVFEEVVPEITDLQGHPSVYERSGALTVDVKVGKVRRISAWYLETT